MSVEFNRPLMPSVPPAAPPPPAAPANVQAPAEVQTTPETPPAPLQAETPPAAPSTQEAPPAEEAQGDINTALESYKPGAWTFTAFGKAGVLPGYENGSKRGIGLSGMYQFDKKSPLSAFSVGGSLGFTEKSYVKDGKEKEYQSFDLGLQAKYGAVKTYLNDSKSLMFKAGPMVDASLSLDLEKGLSADVMPGLYATVASKDGWGVTAFAQQGVMGNQPLFVGAKAEVSFQAIGNLFRR